MFLFNTIAIFYFRLNIYIYPFIPNPSFLSIQEMPVLNGNQRCQSVPPDSDTSTMSYAKSAEKDPPNIGLSNKSSYMKDKIDVNKLNLKKRKVSRSFSDPSVMVPKVELLRNMKRKISTHKQVDSESNFQSFDKTPSDILDELESPAADIPENVALSSDHSPQFIELTKEQISKLEAFKLHDYASDQLDTSPETCPQDKDDQKSSLFLVDLEDSSILSVSEVSGGSIDKEDQKICRLSDHKSFTYDDSDHSNVDSDSEWNDVWERKSSYSSSAATPYAYSSHTATPYSSRATTPFSSRASTPYSSRASTPYSSRASTPFSDRAGTPIEIERRSTESPLFFEKSDFHKPKPIPDYLYTETQSAPNSPKIAARSPQLSGHPDSRWSSPGVAGLQRGTDERSFAIMMATLRRELSSPPPSHYGHRVSASRSESPQLYPRHFGESVYSQREISEPYHSLQPESSSSYYSNVTPTSVSALRRLQTKQWVSSQLPSQSISPSFHRMNRPRAHSVSSIGALTMSYMKKRDG